MTNSSNSNAPQRKALKAPSPVSLDHYFRLILHRKWLVIATFLTVSISTFVVVYRMPNIYTSETVILVDPQKVPESYVKSTITGDVRNRLGTLSQQILSASRLQKVIESLNLYGAERKTMPREDVILKMRSDIAVNIVSDFGGSQDLQAFRIRYSGRDPRLVAQVANELAAQFIDENWKAREAQATGTTEFLQNQLQEARRALDEQEAKLRDFRLKHLGEMPEQQTADLQILGQLQSQLQLEGEALARAEQQRSVIQAMMTQAAPVLDIDSSNPPQQPAAAEAKPAATKPSTLSTLRAQLASMQGRYTDEHPGIRKLRSEIAAEEAREAQANHAAPVAEARPTVTAAVEEPKPAPRRRAPAYSNPVLDSQMRAVDDETGKHKKEQARLQALISGYQRKLESIPVNEQVIAALVRDHDISKAHYQQLLNNQLSAETATQLEIRQKGERFSVLDAAQPAERPSRPNRLLINSAGSLAGLMLGLLLALVSEFLALSITAPEQMAELTNLPVLEVIPMIETHLDRRNRRRRMIFGTVSAALLALVATGAFIVYRLQM